MAAYIKEQIYASTYERNSTLMKEKVYSKPKKANGVKKTIKKVLFYISRGGSINIDNDEVRSIYRETINLNHQRIHRENTQMNQELIRQIIVVAREKLKNLGYINDVHFNIEDLDILLPYPFKYVISPTTRVKEEYKNYIVNGVSDEIDFIEDYVLNANANDIIVSDSNICVELSKIVNDTQLTSEISAFPRNEIMDNNELNGQIRESIQKKI